MFQYCPMMLQWEVLLLALSTPQTAPACTSTHFISHGGLNRSYLLHRPPPCDARPTPMLIAVHCFGCSPQHELSKWRAVTDEIGFSVLAPQGFEQSWNAVHCCGEALKQGLDDVAFIRAAVSDASERAAAASDAFFMTGFSNGGFMASHTASSGAAWGWLRGVAAAAGYSYNPVLPTACDDGIVPLHHAEV